MGKFRPLLIVLTVFALAGTAFGQAWRTAYEQGVAAAKEKRWSDARVAFLQSAAYRPEDTDKPTNLPGPVTERRVWRNGAPYSPNFLAAYSGYKAAQTLAGDERTNLLRSVAAELEERLAKNQTSREAFAVLASVYTQLGEVDKQRGLTNRFSQIGSAVFKVDTEAIEPEDLAAMQPAGTTNQGTTTVTPGQGTTAPIIRVQPGQQGPIPSNAGAPGVVPTLGNKYALIIGNSESRLPGGGIPFAADDAQRIRQALIMSAGYAEGNIDLVINGSAQDMMNSAKAMAERVPNNAIVLIVFIGDGVNRDGRDFLAGVDATSAADVSNMVAKRDLYDLFKVKSANLFAVFQANRPWQDGLYFGREVPLSGPIAQLQATIPGERVQAIFRDGKQVGIFTDAFVAVLNDLKSNQIPIMEFGWQVFYRIRRGGTGQMGGGSNQTPTLPVLINMAAEARF